MPGLVDLQKFIFSDRYHLTPSVLARVCPSMTSLMQWITSFNCCRTSILLLMLSAFLKLKAVYFKVEFTISDFFYFDVQHAHWCTSHLHLLHHQLFDVEDPFLEEVVTSSVFWRNCHLAGCVGVFSLLLKCFFKLLAQLMVLLPYGHFSFFDGRFTVVLLQHSATGEKPCTPLAFAVGSFDQIFHRFLNLPHLPISFGKHGFKLIID